MLTATTRKFYFDPIQDLTLKAEHILVFETYAESFGRDASHLKDTVVKVKGRDWQNGRLWYTTEAGDFVYGAPVDSPEHGHYTPTIGIVNDSLFVYGVMSSESQVVIDGDLDQTKRLAVIRDAIRSDQKVLPGEDWAPGSMTAQYWGKAAPWAQDLFPRPTDTDEMVRIKTTLAEQKWLDRNAMGRLISEGVERRWTTHLNELKEEHDLPSPVFGAYVTGTALIPSGVTSAEDLGEVQQEQLKRLAAASMSTVQVRAQYASTPVAFVGTHLHIDDPEKFDAVPHSTVQSSLRSTVGDYSVLLGEYSLQPVLRSATSR